MDRKREEFCNFTQGRLTVDAYSREFGNLARYCYLLSTSLDFPEEEMMMQQSNVSISLSF